MAPPDARKLTWLGSLSAVLVVGLVAASYHRGTTLSPPVAPASPTDGARCGLIAPHRVRCVALANAPMSVVWGLITDYPRFPELFRGPLFQLELSTHEQQPDGQWRLVGAVSGLMQRWPFEIAAKHTPSANLDLATWEQTSGVLAVDRGSWTLRPRSDTETLVSYEIEVVKPGAPSFVINDVLLDTLPAGIEHLTAVASKAAP
jgi:hypothetical protein